jgi:hypothetical protein
MPQAEAPAQESAPAAALVAPLAVALTTCGRFDATRRALEAFTEHNRAEIESGRLVLLHADDASGDDKILDLAMRHGFETVAVHNVRKGAQEARRAVVGEAAKRGIAYTLLLENDWVMVRPLPWDLIEFFAARSDCYTLRLYGEKREREGDGWPVSNNHAGLGGRDAGWKPVAGAPEQAEIGSIHMGTAPCVTRTDLLLRMLTESKSASDMMRASGRIDKLTMRCVENAGWHIGHGPEFRTPGFVR